MHIVITGASSGIGRALAIHYSKDSANELFLCGRRKPNLEETKKLCAGKPEIKILDITDREAVKQWIKECNPDLVIANAGVATRKETTENIYNTFETNVFGVLNTIQPAIEIFKKRKSGQLAVISSLAGYRGLPSAPSYSASKACVKAYGEALRVSLKPYKIKVSVICPGFIRSEITDKNEFKMPFFMETDKAAKIIARRLERNVGLIAFPWPMRFGAWLISILPNVIGDFVYSLLPEKSEQE